MIKNGELTHSSHGLRGNSSGNALRSVTLERHWLHSHAERGNDGGFRGVIDNG